MAVQRAPETWHASRRHECCTPLALREHATIWAHLAQMPFNGRQTSCGSPASSRSFGRRPEGTRAILRGEPQSCLLHSPGLPT